MLKTSEDLLILGTVIGEVRIYEKKLLLYMSFNSVDMCLAKRSYSKPQTTDPLRFSDARIY